MKTILAAGVALACLIGPAMAQAPTVSRIYKVCWMEDPSCIPLLRQAWNANPARAKCPISDWHLLHGFSLFVPGPPDPDRNLPLLMQSIAVMHTDCKLPTWSSGQPLPTR